MVYVWGMVEWVVGCVLKRNDDGPVITSGSGCQRHFQARWLLQKVRSRAEEFWGPMYLSLIHISEPTRPY